MRAIAITAVLMACTGTPARREPEAPPAPFVTLYEIVIDARVEPAPLESLPEVASAPIDAAPPTVDAFDPDDFYENGIHVVRLDGRLWCSNAGDRRCVTEKIECSKQWRGCQEASSWACFEHTYPAQRSVCVSTLATCEKLRSAALEISTDVSGCTLVRSKSAGVVAQEVAPDPDVFEEDGVQVFIVDEPRWCSYSGRLRNGCWKNAGVCRGLASDCRRTKAWACFDFTGRTNRKTEEWCALTYTYCDRLRDSVADDPEYVDVTGCTIMRLRKGR